MLLDENVQRNFSCLNFTENSFKERSEDRIFHDVRNHLKQVNAKFGCNDLFALDFQVFLSLELGDNGRSRGGCANAVPLLEELLALWIVNRLVDVFHGANQRAFGEGSGRFCALFFAIDSGYGQL